MALNIATFFETSKKIRGGKSVWVADGNGENRKNVLLGTTIANAPKGFGHVYAAQLFEYKPFNDGYIFRSFAVKTATSTSGDTTIYLNGDGYSDIPEVGMLLMKAPDSLVSVSYITNPDGCVKQVVKFTATAGCSTNGNITIGLGGTETAIAVTTAATDAAAVAALVGAGTFANYDVAYTAGGAIVTFTSKVYGSQPQPSIDFASTGVTGTIVEDVEGKAAVIASEVAYTGQSAKVTAVVYDDANKKFEVTLDNALGSLATTDILVEAAGTAKSANASVLVANPNTFIEVDADLMPSNDSYGISNVSHQISTIYDKQAWIARMQPLPKYVLAKNRSYIEGIFHI